MPDKSAGTRKIAGFWRKRRQAVQRVGDAGDQAVLGFCNHDKLLARKPCAVKSPKSGVAMAQSIAIFRANL
jgi:hypothetical protein